MTYDPTANRTIANLANYTQISQIDGNETTDDIPYYIINDITPQPSGFVNNSSKCWINSMMQALLSLAPLYEAVRLAHRPTPVARHFAEMFRAAHGRNPPQSCDSLLEIIAESKTNKRAVRFNFNEQNCAQEAFTLIMDCIGAPADHVAILQRDLWENCPQCRQKSEQRTITSNYLDVYSAELARAGFERVAPLTTPCGFSMYLTMRPSQREHFVCSGCKTVSDKVLTYSNLKTARSIVTVVMHKYGSKPVTTYPLQIMFPAVHQGELVYDLCAVIRHYGTMSSGHYTAVVRRGNPIDTRSIKWWMCNDSTVSELASPPPPVAEDYMLFYVLRGVFLAPEER